MRKKIIIIFILLIFSSIGIFGSQEEEEIKPIEVKSFTEFFDKFHIGMRAEEVLKLYDNKIKLKLGDENKKSSDLKGLEIYENVPFDNLIKYRNKKYDLYFLVYKGIIFQISIYSFYHEYPEDYLGELISFEDYESIKKDFDSNKKYEKIIDEIKTPENEGVNLKSAKQNISIFKYKEYAIGISFYEEIFNEKYSSLLKGLKIEVSQIPYTLYINTTKNQSNKIKKALEQFVNTYLKQ